MLISSTRNFPLLWFYSPLTYGYFCFGYIICSSNFLRKPLTHSRGQTQDIPEGKYWCEVPHRSHLLQLTYHDGMLSHLWQQSLHVMLWYIFALIFDAALLLQKETFIPQQPMRLNRKVVSVSKSKLLLSVPHDLLHRQAVPLQMLANASVGPSIHRGFPVCSLLETCNDAIAAKLVTSARCTIF